MGARLRSQIVKELLSFLRDPKSRFVLIVAPLLQLLVFSFAATLEVSNVDVAVLDQDVGRGSYELLAQIGASSFIGEVLMAESASELAELINRRRALVGLRIPADFSRDLAARQPAKIQLIVDGRRANSGQIAAGYLETLVGRLGGEAAAAAGISTPSVSVRNWFNPNLIYRWFVVPGLAAILATIISLLVTALSIARERELGTFDQLLVSPASPLEIVVSKIVPALIIGSALATVMVAVGVFVFRIPFSGSFPLLFLSLVVFILSVVGVGLMVSSLCQTQQQAILGVFTVAVPVVLISGFATPVENMPYALQLLAEANPLKHFLIIVQGSFLKALPPADVFENLWPMAVIAAVTSSVAVVFVRQRLQ